MLAKQTSGVRSSRNAFIQAVMVLFVMMRVAGKATIIAIPLSIALVGAAIAVMMTPTTAHNCRCQAYCRYRWDPQHHIVLGIHCFRGHTAIDGGVVDLRSDPGAGAVHFIWLS